MKKVESFALFGAKLKNVRWSRCGVSDGSTPYAPAGTKVFSAWNRPHPPYEFYKDPASGLYVNRADWGVGWWERLGGPDMRRLLEGALHTGERVRLVCLEAVDWSADTYETHFAHPLTKLWFTVVRFDLDTGQFEFEQITEAPHHG